MDVVLRSRQLNPCDDLYWKSRGYPERPQNWREILSDDSDEESEYDEYASENEGSLTEESEYEAECLKSNQNNPNNDEYWRARGWPGRPDDWQERINRELSEAESEYEDYSSDDDEESFTDDSDYEEHQTKSNQNNPNNDEYWRLRGFNGRPSDWRERLRR